MAMSQSEIYSLALSVGLSPDRAKVAAAIAMGESGGDPNKRNDNRATGDDSYGLWQINMLGTMGPERRKQFGITSNSDLYNPATNARAMATLSNKGADFNDWSVFRHGTYQKYMGGAVADETKAPGFAGKLAEWLKGNSILGPVTGGVQKVDTTQEALELVKKTASWISNSENWLRVGYVVGGGVLVIAGLVMVVNSTKAGRTITRAATKAATKGLA